MKQTLLDYTCRCIQSSNVPCRKVEPPFQNLCGFDLGLRSSILQLDPDPLSEDISIRFPPQTICHIKDSFFCSYSVMMLPHADGETPEFLLVGPYMKVDITPADIEFLLTQHKLPLSLLPQMTDYYRTLACFPYNDSIQSCLNQLGSVLFGSEELSILYLNIDKMEIWEEYSNTYQFQEAQDPILSMRMMEERYEQENKILDAVRRGDSTEAIGLISGYSAQKMDRRVTDELRDMKDMLLTLNTLLRKEAERGGVHPWHLDQVSREMVTKIEQLNTTTDMSISYKIIRTYCNLVRKFSLSGYSLATQKILLRVDAGLRSDLSLSTLAADLKLNPSYLSSLFKQDMGTSLTDYVNKKRIEFSQKLLRESSLSIQEIGEQAGFADPHYFNRIFKRQNGMTPKEYRTKMQGHKIKKINTGT